MNELWMRGGGFLYYNNQKENKLVGYDRANITLSRYIQLLGTQKLLWIMVHYICECEFNI